MSESEADDTKEIASHLVPNRPALICHNVLGQFWTGPQRHQSTILWIVNRFAANLVKISIGRIRHVIVDDYINTLNMNPLTNQIRCNKYPLVACLESPVTCQPIKISLSLIEMEK